MPYPHLRHNPPTDSTDFHRWDLYKELPQNSRNSQKFRCVYCSVSMAGMPYHPIHLCKSVNSVGVFFYKYFREFRGICGSFLYKYFREFCEICGSFLYKYFREFREICERIMPKAWVWQGCHTLLRSFCEFREFCGSSLYKSHLCKSVKSVGVFLYKYFREFREICGNVLFFSILWER